MKNLFSIVITISLLIACKNGNINLGKELKEGSITYKVDVSGADMNMIQKTVFETAELIISFKDEFVKTEFQFPMAETVFIANGEENRGLMLMKMLNRKIAVKLDEQEMENRKNDGEYEIEYSDEVKKIAGYDCKKAKVKVDDTNSLVMYYTEKISPENKNTSYTFERLKGFPLEMQVETQGMIITMVASSVSEEPIKREAFDMTVPDGYEEMTMEQFKAAGNALQ